MGGLEIRWPDEALERVRAAQGRLLAAGEALRALALEERLELIARVLTLWTAADSPWRRELAESLAANGPFATETVREGLESGLRAWRPDDLVRCARSELAAAQGERALGLAPFAWTGVLAGGSIPMPTLLSALLPLVLGSPVLLRETSDDPVTAPLLARSLYAVDARLARAFEHLAFPSDDADALAAFLEAPCVVATGSDATIESIARRLRPDQRFVAYGHRLSLAVLGSGVARDESTLAETAAGLALDVARWDQTGCLSPVVVYLLGLSEADRQATTTSIAEALDEVGRRLPRGHVPDAMRTLQASERAEARMRESAGRARLVEGSDYTLVLEADARPRPAPLHRFLRLLPVDSTEALARALDPLARHLSTVALAGFEDSPRIARELGLMALGVSRVTKPGRLQTPPVDWPHDGMPLFTPMARFTQWDGDPAS